MNEGQALSAVVAWSVAVFLAILATLVLRRKRGASWQVLFAYSVGSLMLAIAGAIAATHAAFDPAAELPVWLLWPIIGLRSGSSAIFLGLVLMLWGRPRGLVHRYPYWKRNGDGKSNGERWPSR